KYFLGLAPEDNVIHPTTLTKFRRLRLKNEDFLDQLISKSIEIAIQKGVITSNTIIIDATHTKSAYNAKSPIELLRERSKNLRKKVYQIDDTLKEKLPKKYTGSELTDELAYSNELLQLLEKEPKVASIPGIKERMNLLEETIEDDLEHIKSTVDHDAKIGHKTADTAFFGYKTHIAMDDNRLITAAVVTTGEKSDGKYFTELIEKTEQNGIAVKTVLGDAAYSGKDNLSYAKKKRIKLVAKLNPNVSKGGRKDSDGFMFNKDADMMVCPAGELAVRKARQGKKNQNANQVMTYYFDVEKCRKCPIREGCYAEGAKSKTYSISIKSDLHQEQIEFENTEEFKELAKNRYMIEAKNSEIKNRHGYATS
ncbi:transposase, partial [Vagococcus sp. BWB3-3]